MAISGLSSSRRGRGSRYKPLAEINVTPMVDVMLVLLIIFMVTAPLMGSGIPVDVPKASLQPLDVNNTPVMVSIRADGGIFVQETQVPIEGLVAALHTLTQDNPDRRILVRGDKGLSYGQVMAVMGTIYQGGLPKATLIADPPAAAPATDPATGTPAVTATPPATGTPPASGAPATTPPP